MNRELAHPKKKYFKLEYDTVILVKEVLKKPEQRAKYFDLITDYELYGIEPTGISDGGLLFAFAQTKRELDHQTEQHERNRENGYINKTGKLPLIKMLTEEEINRLKNEYQFFDELIDRVQRQIDENKTTVKKACKYIKAYADNLNWNEYINEEINLVSMGIVE